MNNFTYLNNKHVVDCPVETPFYSINNTCISCNSSNLPIFNLKERTCMHTESIIMSNPQFMKNYIELGEETMAFLKKEIDVLKSRGIKIELCPQDKPYKSQNQCIACPDSSKFFDLSTKQCTTCGTGQKCVTV